RTGCATSLCPTASSTTRCAPWTTCGRVFGSCGGRRTASNPLTHEALAGDERHVEHRQQARGCRAHGRDGVEYAHGSGQQARLVVVAALALHLEVDLQVRAALCHDAVATLPERLGPVGCHVVVHARDVFDHDLRFSADDALDLEAEAGHRALLDGADRGVVGLIGGNAVVRL